MADSGFISTDSKVVARLKQMKEQTAASAVRARQEFAKKNARTPMQQKQDVKNINNLWSADSRWNPNRLAADQYRIDRSVQAAQPGGPTMSNQDIVNKVRRQYGLGVITDAASYYASPASSAVSTTGSLRNTADGAREAARAMYSDLVSYDTGYDGDRSWFGQGGGGSETGGTYGYGYGGGAGPGSGEFMSTTTYGETAEGAAMQQQINDLTSRISSGTLSPSEESQVQAEVDRVSESYNQLIAKAQREKALGMSRSTVGAGERGGLMNTQYAGVAALLPTEGGDFVGAGGELNRIQSEYDANISTLESQRLQAMADARSAAMEAISTGNTRALEAAYNAFDVARSTYAEKNDLIKSKMTAVQDYQAKVESARQVSRSSAQDTLSAIKEAGLGVDDLPPGFFDDLDRKLGYPSGTSAAMMKTDTSEQQKQAISAITSLRNAGLFGAMRDEEIEDFAMKIGADSEALLKLRDAENAPSYIPWELTTDPDGNLVAARFNPETGSYESTMLQRKTVRYSGGGSGSGSSDDEDKYIRAFEKDAAGMIESLDAAPYSAKAVAWGTAWDSLHAQYPEIEGWRIDEILGGGYDPQHPDANEQGYWGRAK